MVGSEERNTDSRVRTSPGGAVTTELVCAHHVHVLKSTERHECRDASTHPQTRNTPSVAVLTAEQLQQLVEDAVDAALERHAENVSEPPALLTQAELSKALSVSVRTVHTLRRRGIPTVMVGDSPRFSLSEVIAWFRSQPAVTAGAHQQDTSELRQVSDGCADVSASSNLHREPETNNSAHLRRAGGQR